jgi:hypothetical protein
VHTWKYTRFGNFKVVRIPSFLFEALGREMFEAVILGVIFKIEGATANPDDCTFVPRFWAAAFFSGSALAGARRAHVKIPEPSVSDIRKYRTTSLGATNASFFR